MASSVRAALKACERNAELGAVLRLRATQAVELESQEAAARRAAGMALSAVDGFPFLVKDNIATAELPTEAGSRILKGYCPPEDATVVRRLRSAGAVLLGKTSMDEFGMGSHTRGEDGAAACLNPIDRSRSAGGSSGGSAAAVGAGITAFALGTDTGGSVRLPAAWCGIVGLKPTYGRVPRDGLIAYASSLDTPGVLARNVDDAFDILQIIEGRSERDAVSLNRRPASAERNEPREKTRERIVGIPVECEVEGLSQASTSACSEAADIMRRAGMKVTTVSIPMLSKALAAYYVLAPCEAASNLSRYDGIRYGAGLGDVGETVKLEEAVTNLRTRCFGSEVKKRIITGTFASSSARSKDWLLRAAKLRRLLVQDLARIFREVDFLLTPTALGVAPYLSDVERMDLAEIYAGDVFTVPANLAGIPAVSIPAGTDMPSGMPRAVQLMGPRFSEPRMRPIAQVVESGFKE